MLERVLTTKRCSDIIELLLSKRGWTIAHIARVIGAPSEDVRRIQSREQSFQFSDVESLAKAYRQSPAVFVFDSMKREDFKPDMRGLYDLGRKEIDSHKAFQRAMKRKPAKQKRRSPTKAA